MSVKVLDEILNRLFLDGQFREQLRNDPGPALAGYDLTPEQQARFYILKKRTPQSKQGTFDFPLANPNAPFSLN